MSRANVRAIKRVIVAGDKSNPSGEEQIAARAYACAFLNRSIDYGHARLAAAARIGADIPAEHWDYCSSVVSLCKDTELRDLFSKAVDVSTASMHGTPLPILLKADNFFARTYRFVSAM